MQLTREGCQLHSSGVGFYAGLVFFVTVAAVQLAGKRSPRSFFPSSYSGLAHKIGNVVV